MISLILFFFATIISAHDNCINPFVFTFNKEETLEFTAGMSETPIVFENQDISKAERIQAHYCSFTNPKTVKTSFTLRATSSSTSSTVIYLYRMCDHEIATQAYMKSGHEYNQFSNMNFPVMSFTLDAGETVSFAVALEEKFHGGKAVVSITESYPQPVSNSCQYAKQISVPFTERQYFTKDSQMTQIECNNQVSPHINFNAPSYTYWYKVVGTGRKLRISTCDNFTNIDTRITVLTTCPTSTSQKLYCAGLGNDGCPLFKYATNMYIDTSVGTQYFIAVSVNPEDKTNKVYEGQYSISVEYLGDEHPSVCSNAKQIEQLPFSYKDTIEHDWPASLDKCYENGNDDRAVYLKLIGTGTDVVISACDSVDENNRQIGVNIELLDGCKSKSKCLFTTSEHNEHLCGANMYLHHYTDFGKEYIIRAYCTDDHIQNCPIHLNIYEQGEDHSKCEIAQEISEPYFFESHHQEDMAESLHGCSGRPEGRVLGIWYKLKLDDKKAHQHYKIVARTNAADIGAWIELPMGCGNYTCETSRIFGQIIVDLDEEHREQMVFIYPEEGYGYVGVVVEVDEISAALHPSCEETTEYIQLPYSVIENFDSEEEDLVCTNHRTETSYFKFKLPVDQRIEATTYSDETKVKTGLEISKGCKSEGGLCVAQDGTTENKALMGAQITADLMKDTDYVLTVYSLNFNQFMRVKQYRMIIAEKEIPENSFCTTPVEIDTVAQRQVHSLYTKYSMPTYLSESLGSRKGGFYHIKAPTALQVYLNTCAEETSENTLIAVMKSCSQTGYGERADIKAKDIKHIITTKKDRCGVYGTQMSFSMRKGEERFIFVSAEQANDIAFIKLEMTFIEETGVLTSTVSIIMIPVYVWAAIILLGILVIHFTKKCKRVKKTKSYTAEAQKGYKLLEEFDDDEVVLDNNNDNDSTVYIDEEKDNVELLEF